MSSRTMLVLVFLMAASNLGVSCNENPTRPRQVTVQELQSPAYDRFFNRNVQDVRFAPTGLRGAGSILYTKTTPNGLEFDGGKGAAAAFEPIADQPQMVFAIFYNADAKTDPPLMQCQILVRHDLNNGEIVGNLGNLVVLCNLTVQQCDQVLQDGVPPALVEAMVRTAIESGWTPQIDSGGPYKFTYVESDAFFGSQP